MDLFWIPYWIETIGNLSNYLMAIGILSTIASFVFALFFFFLCKDMWTNEDKREIHFKTSLKAFKFGLVSLCVLFLGVITSSKDVMYKMLAGKAVQELAKMDTTKELVGESGEAFKKSLKLVNKYLDDALQEETGDEK